MTVQIRCLVFLLFIIKFNVSNILFAQSPLLGSKTEYLNLDGSLQYLKSENQPITFEQALVKLSGGEFEKNRGEQPLNFGYDPSDFWFYTDFKIDHTTSRILSIPYPYHQNLTLHIFKNGKWQKVKSGNLQNFETRGNLKPENFAWEFDFDADDQIKVLIQVQSRAPVIMSVQLLSPTKYVQIASTTNLLYGIFYGILIIMVLYNTFLFIIVRDKAYLYYVILVLANIAVFASVSGYAFKYLHPQNPEINFYIREFLIAFLIIPTSLFAISFLDLKKYSPLFQKVLYIMIALGSVICLSTLLGFTFGFSSFIITLQAPLLLIIGIVVRAKGNQAATFYILAWTGYLIGGMAMTLRNQGTLPATFLTDHGAEIGAVLDVFLLAMALAYRYRKIRNEKSALQRENIRLVELQNVLLEEKVRERTKVLNSALEMVQKQHDDLRYKNLEMNSSMNYALKIQDAMFPERSKLKAAFNDFMLFYRPKETVSGDFFFFEQVGNYLFLAVVDCTGHGVPGALMSMAGYNLFYDAVNVEKMVSPKAILEYVERNLYLRLNQRETFLTDGMEVALCVIDKSRNMVRYCGAQRPLLVIEKGTVKQRIKGTKRAIGGHLHNLEHEFTEHSFLYNGHTSLFMYSDGFQDQFGGENDKKFLSKNLEELLSSITTQRGENQESLLTQTFENWRGENDQVDDVLILGVKL